MSSMQQPQDGPPVEEPAIFTGMRRRKNNDLSINTASSSRVHFGEPGLKESLHDEASHVSSLLGGLRLNEVSKHHGNAIRKIDRHFRYFSLWLFIVWSSLTLIMYIVVPKENIVYLSGLEQRAAFTSMSLIFISFLSRVLPLFGVMKMQGGDLIGKNDGNASVTHGGLRNSWKKITMNVSGILLGGLSVQMVAFLTDFIMAFFPVPVLLDPVLGTKVHVLRWCEWAPCAAFMTFMMEGADLSWPRNIDKSKQSDSKHKIEEGPPPDFFKKKYMHAGTQGGAVFLGLMFPFCPGFKTWMCAIVAAVLLYLTNYPRMYQVKSQIPEKLPAEATIEEAERYKSAITALRLRYLCIAMWSIIVAFYFISSIGPLFSSENSILRNPAANMCCESFVDVLSKVLFMVTIMDVHEAIFDPVARSQRRIQELQKLMSALWESSSDPIAISVRTGNGGVCTLLSPAFFALGGGKGLKHLSKDGIKELFSKKSILFHLSEEVFMRGSNPENQGGYEVSGDDILSVNCIDFSTNLSQLSGVMSGIVFAGIEVKPEIGSLRAVAECIVKAWQWQISEQEPVFPHDLRWTREDGHDMLIHSEAKVSRLDESSLILIIRDTSERVKVFETEKKVIFETTSRQKDAEANRFTRHEVKNGLLAAIGLYDSLCEAQSNHLLKESTNDMSFGFGKTDRTTDVVRSMNELGRSLHETLDTIIIEAMTRDLIHDVYRPHREPIDIATAVSGTDNHAYIFGSMSNLRRFPLITRPSPLPKFYLDHHLIRYLHKQVLSNACKYGKTGGDVLTEIIYIKEEKRLKLNVINLPGDFHGKLIDMGFAAEDAVFRKGAQIHDQVRVEAASTVASSVKKAELATHPGDGGWIIHKCATLMKGQCSIKFEDSRTVFTLDIPATPWGSTKLRTSTDIKHFALPPDIWAIGIDDSKIQQKLMGKFFEFAGVATDRIHIFGRNSDEIMGFVDCVVDFMGDHLGDPILLIADENLDIVDEATKHRTVSGSHLVEIIRARLLPEQERCLFSLIRSANDSAGDIAIYNSRAHGFLPKAPIKKSSVLETLAPLWFARYPLSNKINDDEAEAASRPRSDSFSSLESSTSLREAVASAPVDILSVVNEIDKLFTENKVSEDTWDLIREKLHVLKGDLLTMKVGSKVLALVGTIDSFRDSHLDLTHHDNWQVLREQIISLASQYDSGSDR